MNLYLFFTPSLSLQSTTHKHKHKTTMDLSFNFLPKTVSLFLGEISHNKDTSQKLAMLDDFVQRLEEEMKKVEAFKRELPLCMLLVNDAITRLKEEKIGYMRMQDPPVTEQFMPIKTNFEENKKGTLIVTKESGDKKNWMSSVQLWTSQTNLKDVENDRFVPEKPIEQKDKSGGVFMAFNGNLCGVSKVPSFSLVTPVSEVSHSNSKSSSGSSSLRVEIQNQPQPPQPLQQNTRKQRRCWSPELHRRFVDALHHLGGAEVATPKQIRERMQVDGLTNDEVKSHLQKYRIHVRRFPVSPISQANKAFWMNQDQCGDKSKGNSSQSASPQGPLTPLLLGGSAKGLSSHGGYSMEAEDEQSDCRNWKGGIHNEADNHSL